MYESIAFRCRGVTLIELMVTILVLGILAAIATPSMQEMLERRRLVGATEAIYDQFVMARSEAIKQSRDTYVRIQPADACLGIRDLPVPVLANDRCDCTQTTDPEAADACSILEHGTEGRVFRVVQLTDFRDVSIDLPTETTDIDFNFVRGIVEQAANDPFEITASTPKNYELRVVVNVVGRVRICAPAGSSVGGYSPC